MTPPLNYPLPPNPSISLPRWRPQRQVHQAGSVTRARRLSTQFFHPCVLGPGLTGSWLSRVSREGRKHPWRGCWHRLMGRRFKTHLALVCGAWGCVEIRLLVWVITDHVEWCGGRWNVWVDDVELARLMWFRVSRRLRYGPYTILLQSPVVMA